MNQTHRLYVEGHVTAQGFGSFYKPAEERLNQLMAELPRLQGELEVMKVNQISGEDVLTKPIPSTTAGRLWLLMTAGKSPKPCARRLPLEMAKSA